MKFLAEALLMVLTITIFVVIMAVTGYSVIGDYKMALMQFVSCSAAIIDFEIIKMIKRE